jgi:hypothetical protein
MSIKKLNILTSPAHERYESNLAKTGHNFYAWQGNGFKKWNENFAKIPDNYVILNGNGVDQIPLFTDIDVILSHHKFGHFQLFSQISRALQIPLIQLEHTLPTTGMPESNLKQMSMMNGHINVFISEYSSSEWRSNGEIMHHGVDTELFSPSTGDRDCVVLSVVNDWINRDWCCNFQGWKRITHQLPVKVVGDTPGLSKPAKDINHLANLYKYSRIFLNTSTVSPIPYSLLEAMSSGCACVSTATCMIPEIIEHGVNGFISNDENELRKYTIQLLKDEELARKLGNAARQTILEKFSLPYFINRWNQIFENAFTMNWRPI